MLKKQKISSLLLTFAVMLLMTACDMGSSSKTADDAAVDAASKVMLAVEDLAPGYSYLVANANSQIVCAEGGGSAPLIANRANASTWESFKIVSNSDGTVSLLSEANGKYVTVNTASGNVLIASSTSIGTYEKFSRLEQSDGTTAFRSVGVNQYVCADLNANANLYANRGAVAGWEKFKIYTNGENPVQPVDFGPNVIIFDQNSTSAQIQSKCDEIFSIQQTNQFGNQRFAVLFKPGSYNANISVGFYTSVSGLGKSPDDVLITGSVRCEADWFNGNATQNFWRSVENMSVIPTYKSFSIQPDNYECWAVSQAAPFRRMHIRGGMTLWDPGYNYDASWSSGGFIADSKIDGAIESNSQQQWYTRNSNIGAWYGSNWNMVFQGVDNPPAGTWPNPAYTVINETPVVREKPFLFVDSEGKYFVKVPSLRRNSSQITWASGETAGDSIPISQFYIIKENTDNAATINNALAQGKNLLFTPGVYHLNDTIRITRADTVVLGLGLATLIPDNGVVAMSVADVDGVKIAGLLFDAGTTNSSVMLRVGPDGSSASHYANPTSLHDLFFRVGGAVAGKADVCITINSDNVIGDNFWIWRGDHGDGIGWYVNTTKNGIIVNGDDVTIYGLFVEHFHQYQTLWNGNGGRVYFYQSELPYDPPSQTEWRILPVNGYASYKVSDNVTTHEAWGLGIYSFFKDDLNVKLESAIEVPDVPGVKIHHAVTIEYLQNSVGGETGEITHIVNQTGLAATDVNHKRTIDEYPGSPNPL